MMGTTFDQSTTSEAGTNPQITEALACGKYEVALELIRTEKSSRPRDIYLIAAERQVLTLSDLSAKGLLENRHAEELTNLTKDLLERSGASGEGVTERPVDVPAGEVVPTARSHPGVSRRDLDPVKQRYLQFARDSEITGDIDRALLEVRRVLRMDPADPRANEYEQRLLRIQSISLSTMEAADAADHDTGHPGNGVRTEPGPVVTPAPAQPPSAPPSPAPANEPVDASKGPKTQSSLLKRLPQPPAEEIDEEDEEDTPESREEPPKRPQKFWNPIAAVGVALTAGLIATYFSITGEQSTDAVTLQRTAGDQESHVQHNDPATDQSAAPVTKPWEVAQTWTHKSTERKERSAPAREGGKISGRTSESANRRDTNAEDQSQESSRPPETPYDQDSSSATGNDLLSLVAAAVMASPLRGDAVEAKRETVRPPAVLTLIREAQLRNLARPDYPAIARSNRVEGKVNVRILIDSSGAPLRAEILTSTNPLFNEAATAAAMKSIFSPRVTSRGPAQAWLVIPFSFRL